jgi:hypothetical protein
MLSSQPGHAQMCLHKEILECVQQPLPRHNGSMHRCGAIKSSMQAWPRAGGLAHTCPRHTSSTSDMRAVVHSCPFIWDGPAPCSRAPTKPYVLPDRRTPTSSPGNARQRLWPVKTHLCCWWTGLLLLGRRTAATSARTATCWYTGRKRCHASSLSALPRRPVRLKKRCQSACNAHAHK